MKAGNRLVGFEFEHVSDLAHQELARQLIARGIGVDQYATGVSRCPHGCYDGWQVKTDGSITPNPPKFPVGIELVSPPLALSRISQVKQALSFAASHGGINSSCGMHVHVEAPELTHATNGVAGAHIDRGYLAKLIKLWTAIEPVMLNYLPLSRRWSSYSKHGISIDERYRGLNIVPLGETRKTVEFRMHSATLNYNKAMAWAGLCAHLVEAFIAAMHDKELFTKLSKEFDPMHFEKQEPVSFATLSGEKLLLHRAVDAKKRSWVIEGKGQLIEETSLRQAFANHKELLGLKGNNHLRAFGFPRFGNTMSQLCDLIGLRGPYRTYIEDRYESMLVRHGPLNAKSQAIEIVEDDEDFFNETVVAQEPLTN